MLDLSVTCCQPLQVFLFMPAVRRFGMRVTFVSIGSGLLSTGNGCLRGVCAYVVCAFVSRVCACGIMGMCVWLQSGVCVVAVVCVVVCGRCHVCGRV